MRDLTGKNALLTGASGGLGGYLAPALARQGLNLALSGRAASLPLLNALAAEVAALGVRAVVIPADLEQPAERQSLFERAQAELGPIDVLVNNAGRQHIRPFSDVDPATICAIVELNLTASLELGRLVLPGMLARRRGHIVNLSSMAGKSPMTYNATYSATKAALIAWSWALREELAGSGVSVSVICPGFVAEVGMHAASRVTPPWVAREVRPEAVAGAVVDALRRDRPEVLVWPMPVRVLLAIRELAPGLASLFYRLTGVSAFLKRKADVGKTIYR